MTTAQDSTESVESLVPVAGIPSSIRALGAG